MSHQQLPAPPDLQSGGNYSIPQLSPVFPPDISGKQDLSADKQTGAGLKQIIFFKWKRLCSLQFIKPHPGFLFFSFFNPDCIWGYSHLSVNWRIHPSSDGFNHFVIFQFFISVQRVMDCPSRRVENNPGFKNQNSLVTLKNEKQEKICRINFGPSWGLTHKI